MCAVFIRFCNLRSIRIFSIIMDLLNMPSVNIKTEECHLTTEPLPKAEEHAYSAVETFKTLPLVEKKRQTISIKDKTKLIEAYENGENWKIVGSQMGINGRTVKNIVYRYKHYHEISKGPRGGSVCKITHEAGEALLKEIEANPEMLQKDMVHFMMTKFSIKVAECTISNYLHSKCFTFKNRRQTSENRNCEHTKLKRRQYVMEFLRDVRRSSELIYIGECGFNFWTSCRKKREHMQTDREPNISLVLAISKNGPVHSDIFKWSFKDDAYAQFIMNTCAKLPQHQKHYLVHDNALNHIGVITPSPNQAIIQLPPFSPFLNPVESVISSLKERVRQRLNINSPLVGVPDGKIQHLKILITEEIEDKSMLDLRHLYRQVNKYFAPCIDLMDIMVD